MPAEERMNRYDSCVAQQLFVPDERRIKQRNGWSRAVRALRLDATNQHLLLMEVVLRALRWKAGQ